MSKVIEFLEENGPSTNDELPNQPSHSDKMNGLWSFNVRSGRAGDRINIGTTTKIYYLKGYHSKADVLRAWIEENPSVLEKGEVGAINFFNNQGSAWGRVAKHVLRTDYKGEFKQEYNNDFDGNTHTGTWTPEQDWVEEA